MEKSELQAWEDKCIQEEAPACVAGCPIHVDARQFLKHAAQGRWDEALKTLAKTMPFPRILGRICDHPCEQVCKRGEAGDPIAIGALERVCVETARTPFQTVILSRKQTRVAVVGSGLSSLTVAWDLLRKGYRVSLFEPGGRLGGSLWDYPEAILPREVISKELELLEELETEIRYAAPIAEPAFISGLRQDFDAVFLGLDTPGLSTKALGVAKEPLYVHPLTMATSLEGVFAGGTAGQGPIEEVLEGRRAATSMDRFTMQLLLENGREQEGSQPSRLHTSLEGILPMPRHLPRDPQRGYTPEEALQEADRCIQCECLECVKVCLYLDRSKGYPKKYARQVFNNEYVMHGRARTKNLFINECSTCGLCEAVCPNHFHVGDLMLQARRSMVQKKVMPPSFHEFALQDMAYSQSERFRLCRHEPGKTQSAWLYFPSCQLCATCPGEVEASYNYLRGHLEGGVGILLDCCGAPAYWAGREDLFREAQDSIRLAWESFGRPKFITACPTCRHLFQEFLPEMAPLTLWEMVEQFGLPPGLPENPTTIAITDPCMSRHDPPTQARVRRLAQALGFSIRELPLSGDRTECCGYGGLMFNSDPQLAKEIVHRRALALDHDYLAYCAMCRDNLAAEGKRSSHLIEHIFPGVPGADPAARGWISWSERRDHRSRVKDRILQGLDEDLESPTEAHAAMLIHMSPEVQRLMDERRILEEDLRRVINHAEQTGQRLVSSGKDLFKACLQTANVTFWVDYSPEEGGFRVHNAYGHRMQIVGVKG